MKTIDYLRYASEFYIPEKKVYIKSRGDNKFCIFADGFCYLYKDDIWEYEALPSNRTDEFIKNTRYNLIEAFSIVFNSNLGNK